MTMLSLLSMLLMIAHAASASSLSREPLPDQNFDVSDAFFERLSNTDSDGSVYVERFDISNEECNEVQGFCLSPIMAKTIL